MQNEYQAYRYLQKYKYVLSTAKQYSEKKTENPYPEKIWICWLQGIEDAPVLVKRCIESITRHSAGREVVLLTYENLSTYISLPGYIEEKHRKGSIPQAHYSDIIRISLLAEYGGTWIDTTVFLTEELPAYITEASLFCFKSSLMAGNTIKASNWCMSAKPGNKIVCDMRNLLYEYWRRERFLVHYFIFHLLFSIAIDFDEENKKAWEDMPYYNNENPHILWFEFFREFDEQRFKEICKYSPVHKLTYKNLASKDTGKNNTYYNRLIKGELA
nr:capsular polysaccharide synthesis protein [Paludibacter sp. 221]